MHRARRSGHLFLRLSDETVPDITRLLQGEVELVRHTRLLALSPLTGTERGISYDELQLLAALPSSGWVELAELTPDGQRLEKETLRDLALDGLVVTDSSEERLAGLRELDERLTETGWSPHAALYHAYSKWENVDVGELPVAPPTELSARAPLPPPFHVADGAHATLDLPLDRPSKRLFQLLEARATTRGLDPDASLTLDELSLLLSYTFGCHGFADLGNDIVVLKKTSPSGGSLHPVEAYPLVIAVEGVPPGLYHYRADRHALALLTALDSEAARELLVEFTAGQRYLASASVLIVMTARFDRSFWKYRHPRGYAVLHLDAGHLSQTIYLLCAELRLGAFVSAAVNAGNIEDRLGIDGFEEGVIAVCGCGRPSGRRSAYDAEFEPYVPRETVIDVGSG
jgi:putative peptide maturation dehydrogenase